ncbi:MAG: hypothetical protein ACOCP8_04955 [archaeon]
MKNKKIENKNMDRKFNCLEISGSIEEIANVCNDIHNSITEEEMEKEEDVEKFEKWKPEKEDSYNDIKKKTAKKNSIDNEKNNNTIFKGVLNIVRIIEESIYFKIMLKTNPCYYDDRNISCELRREGDEYKLRIFPKKISDEILEKIKINNAVRENFPDSAITINN